MELVGADPDLGSETEFSAVGEASGGVPENTGRIDFEMKLLGSRLVVRDDAVGVV